MPMEVEVNMRIPSLTIRAPGERDTRIDNAAVRFTRITSLPAIPKPGDSLLLTTNKGATTFECTVTRSDWHEEKALFVVSCNYSKRSVSMEMYNTLINDAEWTMKPLL
jgi:hypothetical protein